jgi:ribosomal protein S18 acetylase RimI-like enzyme
MFIYTPSPEHPLRLFAGVTNSNATPSKGTLLTMIIRRAERSDASALSDLTIETYTDAFGHSFRADDLAAEVGANMSEACFERYIDDDVVLIAEIDGRAVGYVQFGTIGAAAQAASPDDRELRRVYVHPGFQGQGIGRRLMDAAFDHPHLKGARNVYLDVWERNHGAQRFYRRYGFEVIGARRFDVASGTPTDLDLIMVR